MKKTTHFSDMLARAVSRMMQDDAIGEVLAFAREDGPLVIYEYSLKELADITEEADQYEMIVFDGANKQGESWKHVFFPLSQQEFISLEPPAPGAEIERTEEREPLLSLVAHKASNYSPRTYHNAKSADLTVAIASDFNTAGEKLTHKAAGDRYVGVPIEMSPKDAAAVILYHLRNRDLKQPTINIAGNGIYTLSKQGWNQQAANLHLVHVLALVHRKHPISKIISGGQTGVDMAGIVAAHLLKIDAEATFPQGFIQRFEDGQDTCRNEADIRSEIIDMANAIRSDLAVLLDTAQQIPAPTPAAPVSEPPQDEFNFGF